MCNLPKASMSKEGLERALEASRDDIDDLYACLVRIVRMVSNGHPAGHDAIVAAKRVIRRVNGGVDADYTCRCTPCALARKAGA